MKPPYVSPCPPPARLPRASLPPTYFAPCPEISATGVSRGFSPRLLSQREAEQRSRVHRAPVAPAPCSSLCPPCCQPSEAWGPSLPSPCTEGAWLRAPDALHPLGQHARSADGPRGLLLLRDPFPRAACPQSVAPQTSGVLSSEIRVSTNKVPQTRLRHNIYTNTAY